MKKILYITTVSGTINAFLIPHINELVKQSNKVDCACNINKHININELNKNVEVFNCGFNRNPLSIKNIKAFKQLLKIQKDNNYDIVHVHTPVASIYGRLLKLKYKNIKTIYTAHGFHFYDKAPKKNWIIYYTIEKIMSKFTDIIITMNDEDYKNAKKLKIKKVYKTNGVGVDLDKYKPISTDNTRLKESLNIKKDDFVILMIAEVNQNKNHKQIIEAIKILKSKGINNIKLICAGNGTLIENIQKTINDNNLEENIMMLGHRSDINELISISDIGVLMSYREGLPRNIMELMACKKPIIGTNIRGIRDLVKDNENGYLLDLDDYINTANKIQKIYNDRNLLESMGNKSYELVQDYSINKVLKQLEEVYK